MEILQFLISDKGLELIGLIIGLLYLLLEYKANIWLWPVGVIMPIVYIIIFYQNKFYADMTFNVYYLFASIYGWYIWANSLEKTDKGLISHLPKKYIGRLTATFVIIFAAIAFSLINFTDSEVPYGDSFTTTLSILAMWMLAHKYIEQWLLWIVVNAVTAVLYHTKELDITVILFIVNFFVSILGYVKWKKMMLEQEQQQAA
ncbi:MAG TPA: nicotinamide riboside transporter PnuC [Dysgonamonadaceae bacterium]|nr:nicotinamide riboside transporter PnuC [Dysgonamonadaceae bacterium]